MDPIYDQKPLSRVEFLLKRIADEGGGGGGGEGMEFIKVDSLPSSGKKNAIYFVRSGVAGDKDVYKEYVYLDGSWERLGQYEGNIDYENIGDKPGAISNDYIDSLFD